MKKLRYILSDYHTIKKADITIDGITVLTGDNGCGKSSLLKLLHRITHIAINNVEKSELSELYRRTEKYTEDTNLPFRIQLFENDIPLLGGDGQFINSNILWKSIFIDDLTLHSFSPVELKKEISRHKILYLSEEISLSQRELLHLIKHTIRGQLIAVSDSTETGKEVYFQRADGVNIDFDSISSGIRLFGYVQLLLENRYLDNKTILLLDDPETHLHPQWIVELARLLVKLHKETGVKVMISSHNPDMIAAIQSISCKESILDNVHFYHAFHEEGTSQYQYKDTGYDIEEAFKSFNIAFSRITDYGISREENDF